MFAANPRMAGVGQWLLPSVPPERLPPELEGERAVRVVLILIIGIGAGALLVDEIIRRLLKR